MQIMLAHDVTQKKNCFFEHPPPSIEEDYMTIWGLFTVPTHLCNGLLMSTIFIGNQISTGWGKIEKAHLPHEFK